METEQEHAPERAPYEQRSDAGVPGGGRGRRDETGHSGVYPLSSSQGASGDAPIKDEHSWGQGARGAAGYEDSGESEIMVDDGTVISGLDAQEQGSGDEHVSQAAPQSTDPTSPATDPLSGQV
jgi:hypothetical protein